jgi:hypothetical protein
VRPLKTDCSARLYSWQVKRSPELDGLLAKEAYAVLERFSAVSVNCFEVSVTSLMNPWSNCQAHLVATCFNRHGLAELGETHECLVNAASRLGR